MDTNCNAENRRGLYNHLPGIPGEFHPAAQGDQVHESQQQFADQHAPEVSQNSITWNPNQYESQAESQRSRVLQKGNPRVPQPV